MLLGKCTTQRHLVLGNPWRCLTLRCSRLATAGLASLRERLSSHVGPKGITVNPGMPCNVIRMGGRIIRFKQIALVAAIVLITAVTTIVVRDALPNDPTLGDSARLVTMISSGLSEKRDYVVFLPEHYSSDGAQRYPVLYVLDGQSQGEHTAAAASLMGRIGAMPEIIVIGISSMDGDIRNRDYTPPDMRLDTDRPGGPTGSGDHFLAFLKDEMIPTVEREYRTQRPRMLAGWSRGGLFVMYSLLAAPTLFDARFAHSPALWREDDRIVAQMDNFFGSPAAAEGFLFLSLGAKENEKMTGAFTRTTAMLERRAPQALRWRSMQSHDGVHETNPRLATPVGLCEFFATAAELGGPACRGAHPETARR